ncbi:50S ribosomal protein L24 [Acidobacteriota bacterium]
MAQRCHIKKNDTVKVNCGKDRGKTGRVLKVFPSEGRAIVENINFVKSHVKANPSKNIKGGIMEKEASIEMSNLQVVCPECSKPTRPGYQIYDEKKVRICRKCSGVLDRE